MTTEQKICMQCGKPQRKRLQGSFTQWIFDKDSCSCGSAWSVPNALVNRKSCASCGRVLSSGNEGSITQWIFSSITCNCTNPVPVVQAAPAPSKATETVVNEKELPLDPGHFPVERYKPLSKLGEGAYGHVYLCRDRLLGKKVAVKTLRSLTGDQYLAFQTEARATSQLDHPAIATLLDFGPTDCGEPYMVLEYFEGMTLKRYVARYGLLTLPQVKQVFTALADALQHAHRNGVLHRDLKPTNFLIARAEDGALDLRLIDFGIAKMQQVAPQAVQSNTMVGTPAYMAPDVAVGNPYDIRSEVYSLGCVIFETLTGEPPLLGETAMETIALHATVPAPRVSEFEPGCPEELEKVVARCLEKNPDLRYQSMDELKEALEELTEIEPADEEPAEVVPKQVQDPMTLRVAVIAVISSIIVLGITALAVWAPPLVHIKSKAAEKSVQLDVLANGYVAPKKPTQFTDDDIKSLVGQGYDRFSFARTNIDGHGLLSLTKTPERVVGLSLSSSKIKHSNLRFLNRFPDLQSLDLGNLELRNSDLENITKIRSLRDLSLAGNLEVGDLGLGVIATSYPDLASLSLAFTSVTDEGMVHLLRLQHLKELNLAGLAIHDRAVEYLSVLPLQRLDLSDTVVGDEGLRELTKCKTLKSLSLVHTTNVTDSGLEAMRIQRPNIQVVTSVPVAR